MYCLVPFAQEPRGSLLKDGHILRPQCRDGPKKLPAKNGQEKMNVRKVKQVVIVAVVSSSSSSSSSSRGGGGSSSSRRSKCKQFPININ